jgi:uncharacterized membrane protein
VTAKKRNGAATAIGSTGLVPQLNAYVLSFLVIAVFWLAHRRFMATIIRVDAPLTVLTLIMLGLVGLVPGATHISLGTSYATGMLLYAALIVLIGVAMAMVWGYASLLADLVLPEISRSSRWFQLVLMVFTAPLFLFLTGKMPLPAAGWAPVMLAGLFLIGWCMRLWVLRRLQRRALKVPPASA